MTETYPTYEEAADHCDTDTEMVCGVRLDTGVDRYFVLSRNISDERAYEIAFQVRHGREISSYEKWLKSVVETKQPETVDA